MFFYWKRSKFSVVVTQKHADLLSGGLFWKSLVLSFRKTYVLSVGFKLKLPRKSVSLCWDKNQFKFCRKTCWKEQPSLFCLFDQSPFSNICIISLYSTNTFDDDRSSLIYNKSAKHKPHECDTSAAGVTHECDTSEKFWFWLRHKQKHISTLLY